jgi:hypothetical protein
MGKKRNAYKILAEKPVTKCPIGDLAFLAKSRVRIKGV